MFSSKAIIIIQKKYKIPRKDKNDPKDEIKSQL
jgi:hypothetical protein